MPIVGYTYFDHHIHLLFDQFKSFSVMLFDLNPADILSGHSAHGSSQVISKNHPVLVLCAPSAQTAMLVSKAERKIKMV